MVDQHDMVPQPGKKRNKQKQEARTRQTLLNYRAETQQKGSEKRTETIKTTKTAGWHLLNKTSSTPDIATGSRAC